MFHCTALLLPPEASIKRESDRPVEFRQSGFDEEFDAHTFFYDLFISDTEHGKNLIFVGPPLYNLFQALCRTRIGSRNLASVVSNYYLRDRCCDVWIPNWNSDVVQLEGDFGSYRLRPQVAASNLYKGKRVLYTLSKDNEVGWIIDWVQFHAHNHGANAVLIYDNASAKYTGDDLEKSLRKALPGLEVNVVHWPYKYGPQGVSSDSWWDSDFCQAGAFQDARFRFLASASSVLNCDVDEFVVSANGESIFDATERNANGCTVFGGRWISNATNATRPNPKSLSDLRHGYFRYLERGAHNVCPMKWCVVPRQCKLEDQWRTHSVRGKDIASSYSDAFSYRHFRSISTNWKYQRYQPSVFDPKLHQSDEALERAFVRAGMARPAARPPHLLSQFVRQIMQPKKLKRVGHRDKPVAATVAVSGNIEAPVPRLAIDPNDPALGGNIIGGDPNTYHPALWSFLVGRFAIKSVLDVGCGEGHCVQYFSGLGIRAFGFDGLKTNVERAVVPIAYHDLRSEAFTMPVDLVLCCEVVEHIDEKYLPNLLETLANGRVIAMTHALPGQTGYHHVNCQPSSYWIGKLEALGYQFLPQETEEGKSRIKASGSWTYFISSGLILERRRK